MDLEDGILALRWNMGLEVGIWASRLGFGSQGWDMSLEAEIWSIRPRTSRRKLEFQFQLLLFQMMEII